MLAYWFTEQLIPTIGIIIGLIVWFIAVSYNGNLAWRHPSELKDRYIAQTRRWPKWIPFRNFYLKRYSTNTFVWEVRIITLIGGLIPLILIGIMILGLLGFIK